MPKKKAPKCTVVFGPEGNKGIAAVLMWRGRSLNAVTFTRAPTYKQQMEAKKKLLRGCAEMVRDVKRAARRG